MKQYTEFQTGLWLISLELIQSSPLMWYELWPRWRTLKSTVENGSLYSSLFRYWFIKLGSSHSPSEKVLIWLSSQELTAKKEELQAAIRREVELIEQFKVFSADCYGFSLVPRLPCSHSLISIAEGARKISITLNRISKQLRWRVGEWYWCKRGNIYSSHTVSRSGVLVTDKRTNQVAIH